MLCFAFFFKLISIDIEPQILINEAFVLFEIEIYCLLNVSIYYSIQLIFCINRFLIGRKYKNKHLMDNPTLDLNGNHNSFC